MADDSESRPKPKRRLTDLRLRAIYYENPSGDRVLLYDAAAAAAARERDAALWARGVRALETSKKGAAAATEAQRKSAAGNHEKWTAYDATRRDPEMSVSARAQRIARKFGLPRWRTVYEYLRTRK